MRIVLAGCTGFIGTALVRALVERGHDCTVLIRGARPRIPDDLENRVRVATYLDLPDGADAVINLAGEPIEGRWTGAKKRRIRDSRVDVTRALVTWMKSLSVKPSVFLCGSACGIYGSHGDKPILESTPPKNPPDFQAEVCQAWESAANEACPLGIRVVNLRIGVVLGAEGGALKQMASMMRFAPVLAPHNPNGYLPWISIEDTVGIICFSLDRTSISGPINLAAPNPATWRDFFREFGTYLGKPVYGRVPGWVLRLVLGEFARSLMASQRLVPGHAVEQGYAFQDHTLSEFFSRIRGAL